MQGHLGEKLIADLIREIAQKNQSGLLRLTRGRSIKAIFFESGKPVFAISNLLGEQLENKLVLDGLATSQQIEQAKSHTGKANRIGTALVEMGVLSEAVMRKLVRQQVMDIILSIFEWTEGDYAFDERIRASHEVTLDLSAADVLLEGARHASGVKQAANIIAPQNAIVARSKQNGFGIDSGRLIPVESYVLSRIDSPTCISEVGALSGIADEDAHAAVCALVAAGFLKRLDGGAGSESEAERESGEDLDQLRKEIARKIHFFSSADYYEVLGIGRLATAGEVKAAYYQLARKFHPDRYRQAAQSDIRHKLEALFTFVTQAYETLSDAAHRAVYDERLRKSPASASAPSPSAPASLKTTPLIIPESVVAEKVSPAQEKKPGGEPGHGFAQPLKQPGAQQNPANQDKSHRVEPIRLDQQQGQPNVAVPGPSPAQQAEQFYKQGRGMFDKKEYHTAVHLLREAVKLDPSRAPYHFHLGLALIRNPRTRREATEHLAKAAELEPYNAQIRVKLGLLYKEAGLQKKAESYFRQALSLDPDNRVAQRELRSTAASKLKEQVGSIWKSDLGTIAKRLFKK